jgi:hypothetical protein
MQNQRLPSQLQQLHGSLFTVATPNIFAIRCFINALAPFGFFTLSVTFMMLLLFMLFMSIYCMKGFKQYVTEDEDVANTIAKLPKDFQELVKGYKFLFEPHNTLKGDDGHVGMITNKPKKIIRIAGPWRYSRDFVVLHEIAHLVYEAYIRGTSLEKEWEIIAKNTKNKKEDETAEELMCHAFAATYCEHPPVIHYHPEWVKFIKKLSKVK